MRLTGSATEGRGLPQSSLGIRPGDCVPRLALLQQDEERYAHSRS